MIPRLDYLKHENGFWFFETTDAVVGTAAMIKSCDTESGEIENYQDRFSKWLSDLNPNLRVRVLTKGAEDELLNSMYPRRAAVRRLKPKAYSHIVVIEQDLKSTLNGILLPFKRPKAQGSENVLNLIASAFEGLQNLGFEISPLKEIDVRSLFISDVSRWVQDIGSVETGSQSIGVVRLVKPSSEPLSFRFLEEVLSKLPIPFEMRVSIERQSRTASEVFLQRRLKQISRSTQSGEAHAKTFEELIQKTTMEGESLIRFEMLLISSRPTKELLRKALAESASILKGYGDIEIETLGCGPSFVSSLPGSSQHVHLLERNKVLPQFLPFYRMGDAGSFSGRAERALTLERLDGSLTSIDLLDLNHQNANAVIVGTSGRGKSVFLGALTHSLFQDENVSILKVDVGGSHSRECKMLQGTEYKLTLSEPSGLNPFSLIQLNDGESLEFERSVLGQFLEVLILENGETHLSKTIRAEIDEALNSYLRSKPQSLSLEGFVTSAECLPRRELFERWVGRGIYANAFRERKEEEGGGADSSSSQAASFGFGTNEESAFTRKRLMSTRLRYFNFSEVFQASDPEFSQAVMAAVLAVFNLEMKLNPERRLVLVCDETPFFINRCFEFFKFSTANVRKFGASVVLTVQLSKHLVVGDDTAVIENSNHRFLFSHDGDDESFKSRFQLSDRVMARLKEITGQKPQGFSLSLYQSGGQAKTVKLTLSKEEYWRLTSTQSDRLKFDALRAAVPNLSVEEAIRCLSV